MLNVIVTGGSRGLGLAISRTLANAGYRVIAIARKETSEFQEAASDVGAGGSGALAFTPFDLSNIDGIAALISSLRNEFGPIYGLVNNAGIGTEGVLANMHNTQI
jgi:3-oxoacyl-[acyl-carrier protein] reductase